METLVLTLDTIAIVVILYFSHKSQSTPGQPELGPFRIRQPDPVEPPSVPAKVARRGVRRL